MGKVKIAFDLHDFSPVNHRLDLLKKIKEHYPNFKVTLFMPPFDTTSGKMASLMNHPDFVNVLSENADWIEIGVHGFTHKFGELDKMPADVVNKLLLATENMIAKIEDEKGIKINFTKGFCAPHWKRTIEVDKALRSRGYWVALNRDGDTNPLNLPFYTYNWSINDVIPDAPIVRGHGHIQDTCGNGLMESYDSVLQMPTDAEFVFASEVLE